MHFSQKIHSVNRRKIKIGICAANGCGVPKTRSRSIPIAPPASDDALPTVRIGYIPLVDSAPVVVASELGLFAKHGLNVKLFREVGWATIKEKLIYGEIEAAHAPAGMAFAMKLGIQCLPCDVETSFILNLNGNAITLSTTLWKKGVRDAATLRQMVRSHTGERLVFGVVSRVSSHHFLMRTWLQSAGIEPDRDVRIVVLPPAQMFPALQAGLLDGYCVGEPWNSKAVLEGVGWCPETSLTLAPQHPEKAFIVRSDFPQRRLTEYLSLLRALNEACEFCEDLSKRQELVEILSRTALPGLRHYLENSLLGPFQQGGGLPQSPLDFHSFHRGETNRPDFAKAAWTLDHLQSSGMIQQSSAHLRNLADSVFREELYDTALAA